MKKIKLGEICDLKSGYAFKSSDYVEKSNTLNCRMSNIRPGAIFDIGYNIKYLPDEYADKYKDFLLYDDDIIIAMTDLAGDPKILGVPAKVVTNGYNILQNQRVGKLIIKDKNKIDFDFLKYALSNPKNKEYYKKFAGGGLQINISNKDVLNIQISIYDKQEQMEIANKLNKLQEIIDIRKKQIEELDKLIKSQFIEMFEKENWNEVELKSVAEIKGRVGWKGYTKSDLKKEGPLVLGATHLSDDGTLDLSEPVFLSEEKYEESPEIMIKINDLIFAQRGSLGKVGLVNYDIGKATINPCVLILRPFDIEPEFLRILMVLEYRNGNLERLNSGSTIPMISQKTIGEYKIIKPNIKLQNKFAEFVKIIDKQKVELQKSLEEMEKLQESLMNKYFG